MNSPPKEKRGCNTALKAAELSRVYHVAPSAQAQWRRERDHLLSLYRRRKNARHWRAYMTHIAGMALRPEASPR
jgi:hypothetical protein